MGVHNLFIFDFTKQFSRPISDVLLLYKLETTEATHKFYIFENPRTWQIIWSFSRVCVDTLVEFYFRVFDEYPKIDFFVCTYFSYVARKNIFEPNLQLHLSHVISWKYIFFRILLLFFSQKNRNFLGQKNSRKIPNG